MLKYKNYDKQKMALRKHLTAVVCSNKHRKHTRNDMIWKEERIKFES